MTIAGHHEQVSQLLSDLDRENVAHAYLFSGARHLGKMTVARMFAERLLCSSVPEEDVPDVQKQISRLLHPDYLVMDQLWIDGVCTDWDIIARSSNIPQSHRAKKPPAKTDSISIDDIRALHERILDKKTGRYRVCIIRSVERMQDAAANAFLKIMEEPPEGMIFLLTTQAYGSLLPTIISRARTVHFHSVSPKEMLPLLQGLSDDDRVFIRHIALGAPGMAVMLRDDPDLLRYHRTHHEAARNFWSSQSLRDRLRFLTPLHSRGEDAEALLLHLGLTLREEQGHMLPERSTALHTLIRGLSTNAHRQLLTQQFALSVDA